MYRVKVYVNDSLIDVSDGYRDLDDAIQAGQDSVGAMDNARFEVMKILSAPLRFSAGGSGDAEAKTRRLVNDYMRLSDGPPVTIHRRR